MALHPEDAEEVAGHTLRRRARKKEEKVARVVVVHRLEPKVLCEQPFVELGTEATRVRVRWLTPHGIRVGDEREQGIPLLEAQARQLCRDEREHIHCQCGHAQ